MSPPEPPPSMAETPSRDDLADAVPALEQLVEVGRRAQERAEGRRGDP